MVMVKAMEKRIKAGNLIRSATAPETMEAAVIAKQTWKKNFASSGMPVQFREEKMPE